MKTKRVLVSLITGLACWLSVSALTGSRTAASPAAPTFTVNSIFDVPADLSDTNYALCRTAYNNTVCTLRAAVMKANRFPGGGVTINIPAGAYTLTTAPAYPYDDLTGAMQISQTMTINGAGINITFVDGGGLDRVFAVVSGTVSLANLTIRGGVVDYLSGYGGGVVNGSVLTLTSVHLTGNSAAVGGGLGNVSGTAVVSNSLIDNNTSYSLGGGVLNDGGNLTLNTTVVANNTSSNYYGGGLSNGRFGPFDPPGVMTLNDSSVSGNHATKGGGIWNGGQEGGASLTVNRSTINANSTSIDGGGIYVYTGTQLIVNNSTISANSAQGNGGGIMNYGSSSLFHVTLAGNMADSDATGGDVGGAIDNNNGSVDIWNSLLAENLVAYVVNDCAGNDSNSHDYNYAQGFCLMTGTKTNNLTGGDPRLGPLQNNGGATQTRALFASSIISDRIPTALCRDSYGAAPTTDQRSVQRPIGPLCDMGAFEGSLPMPLFNTNLIRNGDAEDGGGSPTGAHIGSPHWSVLAGQFTVVQYGAAGGFPAIGTDIIPAAHGYNFFAGGTAASSQATQFITVTAGSGLIAAGQVKYDLSGDFGGYFTDNDSANLVLYFLDSNYVPTGSSITIGNFNAAYRNNQTGLFHAGARGSVPASTRYIQVVLSMNRTNGSYNDGNADNLSLVLYVSRTYLPLVMK